MERTLKILAGLLVGVLVGVGVVLLFSPVSGEELQQSIRERIDYVLEEGRQAAESRREEMSNQFESLKQPLPRA